MNKYIQCLFCDDVKWTGKSSSSLTCSTYKTNPFLSYLLMALTYALTKVPWFELISTVCMFKYRFFDKKMFQKVTAYLCRRNSAHITML